MKIAFTKIKSVKYPCRVDCDNLVLDGYLSRKDSKIVELNANIKGSTYHYCNSCGDEIELEINEDVILQLSDGIYKDNENELSDTMEFYDGEIDLVEILKSELDLYLSDYFYCKNCNKE